MTRLSPEILERKQIMYLMLHTPRVMGWRAYFYFGTLGHFNVGVNVFACPFSGEEDSDVSVNLNLPWSEIGLGVENNPW